MSIRTKFFLSTFLAGGALGALAPALAQEEDEVTRLDQVTIVGLRPVAKEDATVSVTVLDRNALAVRDSPLLSDQLRAVPGLGVSRNGAAGGLTQVRLRGAEANQTLVLVDGIEVSDPVTGETDFGLWSGLDAGRIEVLRGEQSALFGSEAIGGVINVVTNKEAGFAGLAEIGSRGSLRLDGRAGLRFENDGYVVVSTGNSVTNGTDTAGLDGETDGSQHYSGSLRAGVTLQRWQLASLLRYSDSSVDFDEDGNFDGALDNSAAEIDTQQFTVGGSVSGDAFGVNHLLRGSFHVTERETENSGFDNVTDGDRFEVAYSPSVTLETGELTHRFSGLIEYEATDFERRDAPAFFGDPNQSQGFNTLGLAAEYGLSFGAVDLSGSVRFDDNDGLFEDAVTWRIGGGYGFEAIGGRIRASIGEGVTNPTFTELFGFFPGSFVGNPGLVAERSLGWEIGWDQSFGPVTASLTFFSAELEDEIFTAFDANFNSTPQNRADDSDRQGIEFGARWQVNDQLRLSGQATWLDSEDENGVAEIRVPDWTAALSASWQSDAGWRAGIALDLVGEQTDLNFGTFPASTVDLPTYALLSASLDVPVTERLAITVRGENLADSAAQDVFGFNRTGAAGFIGLRFR
jgi:vitamin B12 transporter